MLGLLSSHARTEEPSASDAVGGLPSVPLLQYSARRFEIPLTWRASLCLGDESPTLTPSAPKAGLGVPELEWDVDGNAVSRTVEKLGVILYSGAASIVGDGGIIRRRIIFSVPDRVREFSFEECSTLETSNGGTGGTNLARAGGYMAIQSLLSNLFMGG